MEEVVAASLAERRFTVLLLTAFAAGAVVLAAVSLYGVLSYAVSRRTREIGVRLALGAHPARLVRQVVAQGVALTATGVALGVGGAMALGGVLSGLLYGVRANDPATHAAVAASLLSVAVAACLAPAWRASRVDPIEALRSE
jgi:ABC-type antimicrobial peptide transport system permease subunit